MIVWMLYATEEVVYAAEEVVYATEEVVVESWTRVCVHVEGFSILRDVLTDATAKIRYAQ